MKFENLLSAFEAEIWAIQREKLSFLSDIVVARAFGDKLVPSEMAAAISEARAREVASVDGKVAVVPVYGVLSQKMDMLSAMSGGTSYAGIKRAIHSALSNEDVKAVVLDIDSPGGSVPGTEELSREIRALRGGDKPIIAQVNSLAASAAYWIAASADEIAVTPSGRAGSIGVYTAHDDVSEALAKRGIKRTYISSTPEKVEGNETEPLSKDTLAFIKDGVDRSYRAFLSAVAEGRGTTVGKVEDGYGRGRVFYSEALMDRGMVDRVATLEETVARYGGQAEPDTVRRIKAANQNKADAAVALCVKIAAGDKITVREWENGLKGLAGLSNSEAERAARLYFKDGQGEPDVNAEAAALAAVDRLLAEAKSFRV